MPFFPSYNRFMMPVTFVSDGSSNPPITVRGVVGDPLKQLIETFDGSGNPISTNANAGGDAILGDRRSAFVPGDVLNPSFQTMTASGDNMAANAAGVRLGHGTSQGCALFLGSGAPSSSFPVTSGMPPNGSFYLRADGGAGTTVYQARAGAWVGVV